MLPGCTAGVHLLSETRDVGRRSVAGYTYLRTGLDQAVIEREDDRRGAVA